MRTGAVHRQDGGRQRCTGCGHPRVEHRNVSACTVPKCPCHAYIARPERVGGKDVAR